MERKCEKTKETETDACGQGVEVSAEEKSAVCEAVTELEERVERVGGHVRLRPTLATLFYVLLELDPSTRGRKTPMRARALTLGQFGSDSLA